MTLKRITHKKQGTEHAMYVVQIGERLFPVTLSNASYSKEGLEIIKEEEAYEIKGELKFQ